ncbi:BRE1-domain-containing protein [Fomitopsis betulina]|nr:BRE1-domain-containing protein [Fomitopsis betulina]
MAETKKRPHADDVEQSLPKKRAVSEDKPSASPVNGLASHLDEPKDGDNLEMFRKDAIYRRMKHYSREYERSEARVAELERRRSSCEAGLAALEACWTQIIGTIRMLVKPDDLPPVDVKTEELYDLAAHVSDDADPQYLESLRSKMQATSELVGAFVRLGGQTQAYIVQDPEYRSRQKAQTEESSLRAELSLARSRLRDAEAERDGYRQQLLLVEKRMDRMQSGLANASPSKPLNGEVEVEQPSEVLVLPEPPPVGAAEGGIGSAQEWEAIARYRTTELSRVRTEADHWRMQYSTKMAEIQAITEDVVKATPYYQMHREHTERLEAARREDWQKVSELQDALGKLEATRTEFVTATTVASEHTVAEMKAVLAKRDADNSRLREQRDQQLAELTERRHKEQVKWQSLNEYKQLSESRSERIELLHSELLRLKSRLAAEAGDEDLMQFILRGYSEESKEYINDIKEKLRLSETKVAALEATLSDQQPDSAELQAEANARQRLISAERELQKYRSIYGDVSTASSESASLMERLQLKEHELERLHLQLKQQQDTESSIYAELDKLSAAWEALDKQVQSKAFDLAAVEEKFSKVLAEKAKTESKYHAVARAKESSDSERKQLTRASEKQLKLIDMHEEREKKLSAQLGAAEKELNKMKAFCTQWENVDRRRKIELEDTQSRAIAEKAAYSKAVAALREAFDALAKDRDNLQGAEESALKAKREAERQAAKLKVETQHRSASSGTREAQLQEEVDKCMSILKCSTCKQRMRNTVITKCMHSFCKSCVDARIATRQRKCPACNLAFSQGEVQQLYFQ